LKKKWRQIKINLKKMAPNQYELEKMAPNQYKNLKNGTKSI
jgi:hypothetical protein